MSLTDAKVKNAKAIDKQLKLYDTAGLFLLVVPTRKGSGKRWRFKYRFNGQEKLLALGTYPDVSLAKARSKRDEARQLLADGIDPNEQKKKNQQSLSEAQANTFEKLALQWLEHRKGALADRTLNVMQRRFERDVFPAIGSIPLSQLSPKRILEDVLMPIENRDAVDLVHRIRSSISQVLRYGVAKGQCERDLTTDLRGALKPIKHKHHSAFDADDGTPNAEKVGALLRAIDGFDGTFCLGSA